MTARRRAPFRSALRAGAALAAFLTGLWLLELWVPDVLFERLGITPSVAARFQVAIRGSEGRVLYSGDSVLVWKGPSEKETKSLARLVEGKLHHPVDPLMILAKPPDFVVAEVDYLMRRGVEPALLVVSLNLRLFSPLWEYKPRRDLRYAAAALGSGHPLLQRGLAIFGASFGALTEREYDALPVVADGERLGTLGEVTNITLERWTSRREESATDLRLLFLASYAFDPELGSMVERLERILGALERPSCPVLVYLTPLPLEQARSVLTPEEMRLIESNLGLLREALAATPLHSLDLTSGLGADDFQSPWPSPTEHLRLGGREWVAERLAAEVRRLGLLGSAGPTLAPSREPSRAATGDVEVDGR